MSYIGSAAGVIPVSFSGVNSQSFNGDGSTVAFTLNRPVATVKDVEVVVNNVQQSPYDGSYSVTGSTLTFSAAPSTGTANVYVTFRDQPVGTLTDTTAVSKSGDTMTGDLIVNANVGIGTSSPSCQLVVNGASSSSFVKLMNNTSGGTINDGFDLAFDGATVYYANREAGNHIFETNGAERMRIDSAGRVTMPYQPAWCYNNRNAWTTGQWNVLTFSSYLPISGNRYQGDYTTGTFTAPVTGVYQVNFTDVPYSGGNSAAYVQYNLRKNGASWVWLTHSEYASVRNYEPVSASCVIELFAGDSIAIEAYPESGMNNNNPGACFFSGYLIG